MRVDTMSSGIKLGAVIAAVLWAGAASANPITPTTHYNLGKSPYLADGVDGTPPVPGVNTPNDPVVGLHLQNFFPLIDGVDYTVTPSNTIDDRFLTPQDPGAMLGDASLDDPLLYDGGFTIEWNGTIWGTDYQDALQQFELCDYETSEVCDLMKVDGEVKFMFVIWDIRWAREWDPDEGGEGNFWNNFLAGDVFEHGWSEFESGDPGDPLLTSELLVDDSIAGWVPDIDSGDEQLHIDQGVGVKFAMDINDPFVLNNLFSLGEDVSDICPVSGSNKCRHAILWDIFVYTVPEPGSVMLALSGLVGLALAGSRRRA